MCHLCLSLMDIVLFEMFSTTLLALNIFLYPSNRIFFGHAKERQMNTCKRITDVKRPLFFPNYHERNLHMPTLVMLSMCWFTSSSCSLSPFVTDYWLVKEKKEKNLWKRMKERRRDLLGEGWLCVFDCVVIAQEDGQWRCTSPTKSLNDGKDKSIGRVDESISSRCSEFPSENFYAFFSRSVTVVLDNFESQGKATLLSSLYWHATGNWRETAKWKERSETVP